jgi:hypothetical protein
MPWVDIPDLELADGRIQRGYRSYEPDPPPAVEWLDRRGVMALLGWRDDAMWEQGTTLPVPLTFPAVTKQTRTYEINGSIHYQTPEHLWRWQRDQVLAWADRVRDYAATLQGFVTR